MRRGLWVGLFVLLAACYAEPATHSVALEERDAGEQPGEDAAQDAELEDLLDGTVVADSAVKDSAVVKVDAGCNCSAPKNKCLSGNVCVECTEKADCTGGKSCLLSNNTCVECLGNMDCAGRPEASVCNQTSHTCEPCTDGEDSECSLVTNAKVCKGGTCVQCTQKNPTACKTDNVQYVCDAALSTCTTRAIDSTVVCGECVSDGECAGDTACVVVPAGAGKKVCQPIYHAGTACPPPYRTVPPQNLQSVDGQSVQVCTLSLSSTTCKAHLDHRKDDVRCGVPTGPGSAYDSPNSGDNTVCGVTDRNDGTCLWSPGVLRFFCTVPCTTSDLDCPVNFSCTTQTGLCSI